MSSTATSHRDAAARHELAAENHDRAARFWDDHGDGDRAVLQREMADYERCGAKLERRWADLMDVDPVELATRAAEIEVRQARERAIHLSEVLGRTAIALERSAELADEHAQRREAAERAEDAAKEHQAAGRAREAADRARCQAEAWRKAIEIRDK